MGRTPTTLIIAFALALFVWSCPAEARRVALVIGNSAYQQVPQLTNPRKDAISIAGILRKIGFDDVRLAEDLDHPKLLRALKEFQISSSGAEIALIYFAGHGVEVNGKNYLVPVDASLSEAAVVDYEGITLDQVRSATSRATKLRLVILDACRNNPFKLASSGTVRSVNRGLAIVDEPTSNELIAYAARAGTVASDGTGQTNSPYASALVKHLAEPGLDVRQLFGKVRDDVFSATGRSQEPFTYGSLGGQSIVLNDGSSDSNRPPAPFGNSPNNTEVAAVWAATKDTQSVGVLEAFAKEYQGSVYARMAIARIEELKVNFQSKAQAEQEARRKAEEAKRAEEEIRRADQVRKADEARQAEELRKAESARKAQEEEARRQAELARRAAEQEARRKADEDKRAEAARVAELQRQQKEEAARRAAEEQARRRTEEDERQKVASEAQLKFEVLAKSIQIELDRIGCKPGAMDGKWGSQAKEALRRVPKLQLAKSVVEHPTAEVLEILKPFAPNSCPLVCDDEEEERNGKCVPKQVVSKGKKDWGQRSDRKGPDVSKTEKSSGSIAVKCESYAGLCRGNGSISSPLCPKECLGR